MKKTIYYLCFCIFLAGFCTSCSDAGTEQQQTEATVKVAPQQALNDYRNYVTQFEQDSLTETQLRAMQQAVNDSLTWAEKKQARQEHFQELKRNVQANEEAYTAGERTEIQELEQQYNNAEKQYDNVSRRYALRNDLLGMEVSNDDMHEITAANITPAFRQFVQVLAQKAGQLDARDWEMVQGWWNALNNRRLAVADKLSATDKDAIKAAAKQYQQLIARQVTK